MKRFSTFLSLAVKKHIFAWTMLEKMLLIQLFFVSPLFGMNRPRDRRQLMEPELAGQSQFPDHRTMLKQSVPFIFSARLYPYGSKNGDMTMVGTSSELKLSSTLIFLDQTFDTIWIHKNGIVSMAPEFDSSTVPKSLPVIAGPPLIAVFWANEWNAQRRRVLIRETNENSILALAQSEVNIQFRYGKEFEPKSMVIITWMDSDDDEEKELSDATVLFQLALIIGSNACFAHNIYSKLPKNVKATGGLNEPTFAPSSAETAATGSEMPKSLMLPGSGTSESSQFAEKSNIGIPGEWLMRIDGEQIYLCGAGFRGIECVDSCLPTQWHLDCSRQCHCAEGSACNAETGECPNGKCNPGWKGAPVCDEDIDECQDETVSCPNEQPDCINTPGAYLCACYEYDNSTEKCIGSSATGVGIGASLPSQQIPVPIPSMVLTPQFVQPVEGVKFFHQTTTKVPSIMPSEIPRPSTPKLLLLSQEKLQKTERPLKSVSAFAPPLVHSTSASQEHHSACSECDVNAVCAQGECQCSDGWSGDGKICTDIDECAQNSTICGRYAECQNMPGSYQCICNVGFIARPDGQGCIDVDECEESGSETTVICPQQNTVCTNFVGGFDCQCKSGFAGDPLNGGCKDINECEMAEHYCGRAQLFNAKKFFPYYARFGHANCTNLDGTFNCDCHDGFEKRVPPTTMPNGQCQDINECDNKAAVCHRAATCTNVEGSFHCECVEGFVGNGKECRETVLFPTGQKRSIFNDASLTHINKSLHLDVPIQIFAQNYTQFYVSPNGYVSFNLHFNDSMNFDELFKNFQFNAGGPIFLPLLAKYSSHNSEFIDIQQINEQSPQSKGLLSRAALEIQQHFRIADFKPKRLIIMTWAEMRTVPLQTKTWALGSTFQLILIDGILSSTSAAGATFAIFLYESVHMDGTRFFTGIVHPTDGVLSPIPFEQLTIGSNVGHQGKWIFRCDQNKLYTCPAGTRGAPLCQEDCEPGKFGLDCEGKCRCANSLPCDFATGICPDGKCTAGFSGTNCDADLDECALATHRCDKNAICSNLIGSYTCTCKENFHGSGFNCSVVDLCLLRFQSKCAQNARCDSTNEELAECVCDDGFHGDGRRKCMPIDMTTAMATLPSSTTTTTLTTTSMTTTSVPPTTSSFTFASSSTPVALTVFFTTNRRKVGSFVTTKSGQNGGDGTEVTKASTPSLSSSGINVPIGSSNTKQLLSEANESKVLVLVVCAAIGAVWLIVATFFSLIYCVKRHRRIRVSEYSPEMLSWNATRTVMRPHAAAAARRSDYNFTSTKFI